GQLVHEGDPLFALDPTPLREEIHAREQAIRAMEAERQGLQTHDGAPEFREAVRDLDRAAHHLAALQRKGRATDADIWAYQQTAVRRREQRERRWPWQSHIRD